MKRLLSAIVRRADIMIVVTLLITAVMSFFALKIKLDPDYYCIFPENNKRSAELLENTGITETLDMMMILSVSADDALSVKKLGLLYDVIKELEQHPLVAQCTTPFNFITFNNVNGRLSIEKMADSPPSNEEELAEFKKRLLNEPLAQDIIVSDDGTTLNVLITNTAIEEPAKYMEDFDKIISPLKGEFEIAYTGDIPFSDHTINYLKRDLLVLVLLAAVVILIVLYLSFRALRAVFLPFLTVAIGAIWAVGFSALIGYKLTVVSVVLPIIILAIGSSYTVHILSEYFRSYDGGDKVEGICLAVLHVIKTVMLAGLTTIIGFCSLLFTSIRPLREFGLTVSFGILSCVILTIFFLPAMLSKFSPPRKEQKEKINNDFITKIVVIIGRFVGKWYPILFILFFIIIILAIVLFPHIDRKVNYIAYFPSKDKLVKDTYEIISDSGGYQSINITLQAPDGAEG
ncbi:MAG: MMPL family transporter, partial [Spirochaetales bacterium]|nr:MMPL family transporter [Spirochaetales bacterium]